MIPDRSHSTKSMLLAAAELRRSYRTAENDQRRRLILAEAITAANLRFIESGSISQMAAVLLDASMTVTNSPFGMFYGLLPNGSASIQALSPASFDPVSEEESFRNIQYEIRRYGSYEMKRHPSIFFAAANEQQSSADFPHELLNLVMKPYNPVELTQIVNEYLGTAPWRETNGGLS